MIKHIAHLFILPLRALIMVVATFPTGHACGGPVTGVCSMPPALHHRVVRAHVVRSAAGPVSWRIAPSGPGAGALGKEVER